MSAAHVRGWCPSLHEPMAALDGLIVRVKPRVRGLSAHDLRLIAATAERAGAGGLELTARSALQVRGLTAQGAEMFARAMVEADLASADAAVERRRNLQLGLGCGAALYGLAAALETWLEEDTSLEGLPAKFGFAVSLDAEIPADIAVVGEDETLIAIGGEVAVSAAIGTRGALTSCDPPPPSALPGHVPDMKEGARGRYRPGAASNHDVALDAVQRLTRAFLALTLKQPTPPRRMKGLIQAVGAAAVLAEAGLIEAPCPPRPIAPPNVGFGHSGFGLGVVFGVLTPDALRAAADLATHYGDGRTGLAPGRAIWLHGVASSAAPRLAAAASAAGFVVDPQDLRLRLDACIGRAGCAKASQDVRADALRLASAAPATGLHVSGCVKGCAHPGVAGVTLVSRAEPGRYDLILNGAPSSPATWADIALDDVRDRLARRAP